MTRELILLSLCGSELGSWYLWTCSAFPVGQPQVFSPPSLSGTGLRPIPKLNICLPNMQSCDQPAAGLLHSMPPASSLSREKELGAELRAKFRRWFGESLSISVQSYAKLSGSPPKEHCKLAYGFNNSWGRDTAFCFPNGRKQQISFFSKVMLLFCFVYLG